MTPQERDLITALLARLQQQSGAARDPEADALIRDGGARIPDALYLLVQTVLIQDMALHDAQNRIAELERARDAAGATQAPPSFLPPRGSQAPAQGSVPSAGRWSNNASAGAPPREPVWSQSTAAPPSAPMAPPAPGYGSLGYGGSGYGPQMLTGGGSGFLRQAAATAAGVVGGSLLFQGLHSMFAPTYGSGFLSGMPMQPGISETVINNYYNDDSNGPNDQNAQQSANYIDSQDAGQDYADNDPGFDPGGGDDGGNYDV
ncbi:MAG TPA: DUF2076 domain-containing protein [Stellaceae bacterium]|jgi:hypothetical protein|nr:DUF2076 domain-containing protein [Stellaceae bacterium]